MSRIRQVVLLLDSLERFHAPFTDPKTATRTESGFAPVEKRTCPECLGEKPACKLCAKENGKPRGYIWIDPMKLEDGGRVEGAPERKSRGGGLKATKKKGVAKHDLSMVVGPMIHARHERDKSGSYRELELALASLRQSDEFAWCIIRNQHFEDRRVQDYGQLWAYCRGLRFLEQRMPTPIRVPVSVIVEAEAKKGTPIGQMSRDLGISRERVKRKLRRAA